MSETHKIISAIMYHSGSTIIGMLSLLYAYKSESGESSHNFNCFLHILSNLLPITPQITPFSFLSNVLKDKLNLRGQLIITIPVQAFLMLLNILAGKKAKALAAIVVILQSVVAGTTFMITTDIFCKAYPGLKFYIICLLPLFPHLIMGILKLIFKNVDQGIEISFIIFGLILSAVFEIFIIRFKDIVDKEERKIISNGDLPNPESDPSTPPKNNDKTSNEYLSKLLHEEESTKLPFFGKEMKNLLLIVFFIFSGYQAVDTLRFKTDVNFYKFLTQCALYVFSAVAIDKFSLRMHSVLIIFSFLAAIFNFVLMFLKKDKTGTKNYLDFYSYYCQSGPVLVLIFMMKKYDIKDTINNAYIIGMLNFVTLIEHHFLKLLFVNAMKSYIPMSLYSMIFNVLSMIFLFKDKDVIYNETTNEGIDTKAPEAVPSLESKITSEPTNPVTDNMNTEDNKFADFMDMNDNANKEMDL